MKVLQALAVAACLFLTFVAFEYYNSMCLVLVYLAVLYSLGEIRAQKTQSIKRIIPLVSTLYVIGSVLFGVSFLTFILCKNLFKKGETSPKSPGSETASDMRDFAMIYLRYYCWYISVLTAAIPQLLVGFCYRFDSANSPEVDLSAKADAETVEVTTPIALGVTVPKRLPNKFSKPYYLTALGVWCFANLVFLYLLAVGFVSFGMRLPDTAYGLSVAITTTPVMLLAMVGLAAVRGELQKMWAYEEEWGVDVKKPDCNEAAPLLTEVEANEKV